MIAAAAIAGYIVALPVFLWHRHDLLSFPRSLWWGFGSRTDRIVGAGICYAALGWPEIFMALGWRTSRTREMLTVVREQESSSQQ